MKGVEIVTLPQAAKYFCLTLHLVNCNLECFPSNAADTGSTLAMGNCYPSFLGREDCARLSGLSNEVSLALVCFLPLMSSSTPPGLTSCFLFPTSWNTCPLSAAQP